MTTSDRDLDKVLAGKATANEETAPMVETARRLEGMFAVDVPESPGARALFTTAVGTRSRPTVWRFVAPSFAAACLLIAVYFAGRSATPGNALYPVRKALQQVDLAPATVEQVDDRLADATRSVVEAEGLVEDSPRRAQALATRALKMLGAAEALLDDLPADQRDTSKRAADQLETRALAVLLAAFEEDEPEVLEERADELDEDNSGTGSGSEQSGDDNSGSGSDDSDDDNSGSGSDESDSDDDNSGSGSSGSGSDDDNSGSGSSGSGSDDDNSGSGSSGSGSDDGDNSGSGSDDDD